MKRIFLLAIISSTILLAACKKDPEVLSFSSMSDYAPLAVGKYITYQLDTFKYQTFSLRDTNIKYQVKYLVDASIKDNYGRPAYRIIRYIRKTAQNNWVPDHTFSALNTGKSFEFVENNLRFIKLKDPITEGYSWKGNSFIDTYSLNSTVTYLDDWDYVYEAVNEPLTLGTIQLDSTITVNQRDEVLGSTGFYNQTNLSVEKYAKGIGLVYKKFLHTEFQPASPGSGAFYTDDSYGVTLTMIDHN